MKRNFLIILAIIAIFSNSLYAGLSKTVTCTAGDLSNILGVDITTITDLTITGSINSVDFVTMRDQMLLLENIDLSNVSIVGNSIPSYAFCYTTNKGKKTIKTIKLPDNITTIGESAFYDCSNLISINIPLSVNILKNASFARCISLSSISLPNSLKTIEESAFSECYALSGIFVPASVTSIGDWSFSDCGGVIEVDLNNLNYSSNNGVLLNKSQTILIKCPTSISGNYEIPSTVTTVKDWAFRACNKIETIKIPSSTVSIAGYSFASCTGSFIVDLDNPNFSSNSGVLFNKAQTILIKSPISKVGSYTMPTSTISIADNAFMNCEELTEVISPQSLIFIGMNAFYYCTKLKKFYIPSGILSIGDNAFNYWGADVSIYSYSTSPNDISLSSNPFSFTYGTLYVPVGSKTSYQTSPWNRFIIVETQLPELPSAINNVKMIVSFSLFPNPCRNFITMNTNKVNGLIQIIDINGFVLLSKEIETNKTIDICSLSNGVYFLQFNNDIVKFIKK